MDDMASNVYLVNYAFIGKIYLCFGEKCSVFDKVIVWNSLYLNTT